jgi:hypothetical protein
MSQQEKAYQLDPKKPRLKRDWVGRTVRTRRELRNGMITIPAGTIAEVTYNRAGLELSTTSCESCGVRVFIRGVAEHDVDLLLDD